MKTTLGITVTLTLVALAPLGVAGCGWRLAQSNSPGLPVEPGQWVRVTAPSVGANNLVGSVIALRTDTLVVQDEAQATPLAIPFASVTRLDVRVRKGRTHEGIAIGFFAGILTGFVIHAAERETSRGPLAPSAGEAAILVGPLAGMLIGAVVGSGIRRDSWKEVPLDRPPDPLRVGLVSWWPGDGNANDVIGGHDGVLRNGATFAPGAVGQAFSLDGVDDYVSINNSINFSGDYSVTGWFKTTASGRFQALFAATGFNPNPPFDSGHGIFVELEDDGRLRFLHRSPLGNTLGTDIFSATTYDDGAFHYFVAAKEASTMRLHVDGVLVATASDDSFFTTTLKNIVLGQLLEGVSARHWDGILDEVSVYDRALSPAEIQAIFNASS